MIFWFIDDYFPVHERLASIVLADGASLRGFCRATAARRKQTVGNRAAADQLIGICFLDAPRFIYHPKVPSTAGTHTEQILMKTTFLRIICVMAIFGAIAVEPQTLFFAQARPASEPPPKSSNTEIERLKKENELLRKENQDLRRLLGGGSAAPTSPSVPQKTNPAGSPPPNSAPKSATQPPLVAPQSVKWSLSSTGKRHNSSCRFFNAANPSAQNDGVACKICGG